MAMIGFGRAILISWLISRTIGNIGALWTLGGTAIYPVVLFGAELSILILDSFSQAAGFAVFSERPCTGLIFNAVQIVHPGQTIQLGVKFAADGEASDVPLLRGKSPNTPSCKGAIAGDTCHPGITRLLEGLHKRCLWHATASTAFW